MPLNRYQRICPGGRPLSHNQWGLVCSGHFRSLEPFNGSKRLLRRICHCRGPAEEPALAGCCQSHNESWVLCPCEPPTLNKRVSHVKCWHIFSSIRILQLALQSKTIIFPRNAQYDRGILLCKGWTPCEFCYLRMRAYSIAFFFFFFSMELLTVSSSCLYICAGDVGLVVLTWLTSFISFKTHYVAMLSGCSFT